MSAWVSSTKGVFTGRVNPASCLLSPTAGFHLCSAGVAFGSQPRGHKTRLKQQMSPRGSLEDCPSGHPGKPQLLSHPNWRMCMLRLGLDPNLTTGCPVEVLFLQVAGKTCNDMSRKLLLVEHVEYVRLVTLHPGGGLWLIAAHRNGNTDLLASVGSCRVTGTCSSASGALAGPAGTHIF